MELTHLIYIPFTGLGAINDGFRSQEWYEARAEVFKNTTLKSLFNQTCKNFILWISFRPEEENNPTTQKIEHYIQESGLKYILTFDGIMMYDDRGTHHNVNLKERIEKSVNKIKEKFEIKNWIYRTDCGSDDMLIDKAIEELQQEEPRINGAIFYRNGYIYNVQTKQLAYWLRNTACSKYTIMFDKETFLNSEKHFEYINKLESHEFIPLKFDATRFPDNRYCCTVHGYNISTTWNNSFRGEEIIKNKENILKKFGL